MKNILLRPIIAVIFIFPNLAFGECYSVYSLAGKLIFQSSTPPVSLSEPSLSDAINRRFPNSSLTIGPPGEFCIEFDGRTETAENSKWTKPVSAAKYGDRSYREVDKLIRSRQPNESNGLRRTKTISTKQAIAPEYFSPSRPSYISPTASVGGLIIGGPLNGSVLPDGKSGLVIGGALNGSILPGRDGGVIIGGPFNGSIVPGSDGGIVIGGPLDGSLMPGSAGGVIIGGPLDGEIIPGD